MSLKSQFFRSLKKLSISDDSLKTGITKLIFEFTINL